MAGYWMLFRKEQHDLINNSFKTDYSSQVHKCLEKKLHFMVITYVYITPNRTLAAPQKISSCPLFTCKPLPPIIGTIILTLIINAFLIFQLILTLKNESLDVIVKFVY